MHRTARTVLLAGLAVAAAARAGAQGPPETGRIDAMFEAQRKLLEEQAARLRGEQAELLARKTALERERARLEREVEALRLDLAQVKPVPAGGPWIALGEAALTDANGGAVALPALTLVEPAAEDGGPFAVRVAGAVYRADPAMFAPVAQVRRHLEAEASNHAGAALRCLEDAQAALLRADGPGEAARAAAAAAAAARRGALAEQEAARRAERLLAAVNAAASGETPPAGP